MLVLGAILLTIGFAIWTQQRRLIYFPSGHPRDPLAIGLVGAVPVTFPTADGLTLNGWFITRTDNPASTIIVFNGNAGNREFRADLGNGFARRGFAVLLFDYRGYGGNLGSPSEDGLKLDARAARSHIVRLPGMDPKRLVYFGESLGAAVAAELAEEHPPAALILRSPFTSLTDIGRVHYRFLPVRWLLRDRFATIDRISAMRAPLLVIAGDKDRIVPASQSRRLYDAANDPKSLVIVPGADHNDESLNSGAGMIDAVSEFLRQVGT